MSTVAHLPGDTKVTLADGSTKCLRSVKTGEHILAYSEYFREFVTNQTARNLRKVQITPENSFVEIVTSMGTLICESSQVVFCRDDYKDKTIRCYAGELTTGDRICFVERSSRGYSFIVFLDIKSISKIDGVDLYTIKITGEDNSCHNLVANGFLVGDSSL